MAERIRNSAAKNAKSNIIMNWVRSAGLTADVSFPAYQEIMKFWTR